MIKHLKRQKWIFLDRFQLMRKVQKTDKPLKIIIGAGHTHFSDWVKTDYPVFNVLSKYDWHFIFQTKRIDNLLAEHVLEHFTVQQVEKTLSIAYKFLEPGGVFRIAVPDQFHPNKEYIEYVRPNGNGPGADDHKSFWNYQTLSELGKKLGYTIEIVEYWDLNRNFSFKGLDPGRGHVNRSKGTGFKMEIEDYSSLIIDLVK
jgi:predicted SAM-dependent methyltransferase